MPPIFPRAAPASRTPPTPSAPQPSPTKNFLAANMVVEGAPRPSVADAAVPPPKKEGYGKVPEYLETRKAMWKVEEAARQKEAEIKAACPPGHRMLPEEERTETLTLVTTSLDAAKKDLLAMPLRIEIPSALRRKADLEAKIAKLEDAVKIFSRPRVFVKLE
jgi:hypothetical protein